MTTLECEEAQLLLLDHHAGRLRADQRGRLAAHLANCEACAEADAEERVVTELLQTRLDREPAPAALRARVAQSIADPAALRARVAQSIADPAARSRRPNRLVATSVAALVACAAGLVLFVSRGVRDADDDPLIREVVNDHLRVLYATNPIEIGNGGLHQVRPWFTGRLDFAPALSFVGNDDFRLDGASLGYFVDRKAAVFVWKRRLHTITLLQVRADGLRWPAENTTQTTRRGFHVLLWREHDLAMALVSDAEPSTLRALQTKLRAPGNE